MIQSVQSLSVLGEGGNFQLPGILVAIHYELATLPKTMAECEAKSPISLNRIFSISFEFTFPETAKDLEKRPKPPKERIVFQHLFSGANMLKFWGVIPSSCVNHES